MFTTPHQVLRRLEIADGRYWLFIFSGEVAFRLMRRSEYFTLILILGSLCTISPFAIDMYLPGFPAIAEDLSTSISAVQLSLTSYLVGISLGQLLYGPLLDRFGRKSPLYIGLVLYIVSSLGCALTTSVETLIAMRFVQALGGCVGMVAAQALVRDIFPVNKTAQVFSLLTLVIAISPMIAPTLGGYITTAFDWHYVFILLAIITAVIMVATYFVLPQGNAPDPSISLRPKPVLKSYLRVIKEPQFLIYTLAGGIATAAPFAYIAGSANVFINLYQMSEQQYGWTFALLAFAMIGTTQLNHILLKKLSSQKIVRFTLLYQSLIGIILVLGVWMNIVGPYGLIGLLFVFLTGQGLSNPNATALSLAPFSRFAGSAAALMGSFRMAMGGLVSAVVSFFHTGTALPMVGTMAFCAIAGLSALVIGKVKVRHKARKRAVEEDTSVLL